MSNKKSYSLVNLGDLSKPADTLIKKVSDAVGGFFKPYQITKIAKADAKASMIAAVSDIEITELHHRAMHRFVEEEAKRQRNMENITSKALPQLDDKGDPSQIEDDWITNFFDKCRIVSDDEMQNLWSRVLSGEANVPGTYSKRTVNFLSDLNKDDAECFGNLCRFGLIIEDAFRALVFKHDDDIYKNNGINFGVLLHLDSIGLIQFDHLADYQLKEMSNKIITVHYDDQGLELFFNKEPNQELEIGKVILTTIGTELAPICSQDPVPGFMDYIKDVWKRHTQEDNS